MADNTFGIYVNDALKMVNHRAARVGVQHHNQITPLDPTPGEAITVHVVTPGKEGFTQAALYYTTDGHTPSGSRGVAETGTAVGFHQARIEWDVPTWDYLIHWEAEIPGQPDGTVVQYMISAWNERGDEVFADWPDVDEQVHHATMRHFQSIPDDAPIVLTDHFPGQRVFNVHVDTLVPPAWANDAIIYHIFLDRFYPGDGRDWQQTDDLGKIFGGTLHGVHDKLDYIAELGVNCIWLSPTWATSTYHGYDVKDYERTEPRLGGDDALRAVVEGAHQRGIRVLLDMVCNHISNEHPIFVDAMSNPDSLYRDWFFFDERLKNGYKSFFGVVTMPRINLDHPPAREWMVGNGVRWIRDFDVDGYRLDVADGPGPNFWSYFRHACRAVKPDCLIFGEIIDIPERLRTYAGRLDGCLDFPLNDVLRRSFGWGTMTEAQLDAFVRHNTAFYPADYVAPTFLDNHDMDRFLSIAGDDGDKLKRAAEFQFQLPQPPIIYSGTEVGLSQQSDIKTKGFEECRYPMLWGDAQNADLLAFYKALIRARKG